MYLKLAMIMAGLFVAGQAMGQGVRWEDYRGDSNVAADANYTGPTGAPKYTNYPNSVSIANLRAVSANPANAVRTGTSNTIDFASLATNSLCNNVANLASVPCLLQAQGKVMYALIRFPQVGTYSIAAAHDDNVVIELSPDYTNTAYRSANYSILAGSVADWTANDTTFATFGTFNAPNANSCALLRMYWNNQGGLNFDRLQWTTPGGTTQIVPASALLDPAAAASSAGCNGSVTTNTIQLNKAMATSRIDASDQFTIEVGTTASAGTVTSATTAGAGTGQQATTTLNPANLGTTYYLREVMAAGSASGLTAYAATIACTRNGVAYIPTVVSAANRRWSISTSLGSDASVNFICTITNQKPAADLSITKSNGSVSVTAGGTTTYTIRVTNNAGSDPVTGAILSDPIAARLTKTTIACSGTPGQCTPGTTPTIAQLEGGYALPTLAAGQFYEITVTCTVN